MFRRTLKFFERVRIAYHIYMYERISRRTTVGEWVPYVKKVKP